MSLARQNHSSHALIDTNLYATGTCKNVWRGTYTRGSRTGQPCVAKEFKPSFSSSSSSSSSLAESYFAQELNIVRLTQTLVNSWHAARLIDAAIVVNVPEIWEYVVRVHGKRKKKTLVEPFITGFRKFNSNTGWTPPGARWDMWCEVMQALSHFSYHVTGGALLLCDLQGGPFQSG